MRCKLIASMMTTLVLAHVAYADGRFVRDVDHSTLSQVFSKATFGDLAVGDGAYAKLWDFCWRDNHLFLIATKGTSERSDWAVNLRVTRQIGGAISIKTELGARASGEDVHNTIMGLSAILDCDDATKALSFDPQSLILMDVTSIDEMGSLSDLASRAAEDAVTSLVTGVPDNTGDPDTGSNDWVFRQESDEITDEKNIFISKDSNDLIFGMFNSKWSPNIILRCMRNKSSVFVNIDEFMSSDRVRVSYRFDESAPVVSNWEVSSNRKAVGLWSGQDSIPFMKRLVDAGKLSMRVETGRSVHTFSFAISGAREHVEKLAAACNWSF